MGGIRLSLGHLQGNKGSLCGSAVDKIGVVSYRVSGFMSLRFSVFSPYLNKTKGGHDPFGIYWDTFN
jgi:hypothetical protein